MSKRTYISILMVLLFAVPVFGQPTERTTAVVLIDTDTPLEIHLNGKEYTVLPEDHLSQLPLLLGLNIMKVSPMNGIRQPFFEEINVESIDEKVLKKFHLKNSSRESTETITASYGNEPEIIQVNNCQDCLGLLMFEGYKECGDCNGKGTQVSMVYCNACSGRGELYRGCLTCKGVGGVSCTLCQGQEHDPDLLYLIKLFKKKANCNRCLGDGLMNCPDNCSTGQVVTNSCPDCNGRGLRSSSDLCHNCRGGKKVYVSELCMHPLVKGRPVLTISSDVDVEITLSNSSVTSKEFKVSADIPIVFLIAIGQNNLFIKEEGGSSRTTVRSIIGSHEKNSVLAIKSSDLQN